MLSSPSWGYTEVVLLSGGEKAGGGESGEAKFWGSFGNQKSRCSGEKDTITHRAVY